MTSALAARALALARAEVGARVEAGRADAGITLAALADRVAADPVSAPALAGALAARRREDPLGPAAAASPSPRRDREARTWEARGAVGELVLAGELMGDGPERVVLPGFGGSTWRALALLRPGGQVAAERAAKWPQPAAGATAEIRLALAVVAGPVGDLAAAAPALLGDLAPDPTLAPAAARLHLLEALRQDHRHALITAEAAMAFATGAGHDDSARTLRAECRALEGRLAAMDRAIAAAWAEGLRVAADR